MQTWIALFRGINVGGKNKMRMVTLKAVLESVNCKRVRTYIQSGNVIFTSGSKSKRNLVTRILDATELEFGFRPKLLLLSEAEFSAAIENNPFVDETSDPKTLTFFFLDTKPVSFDNDAIVKLAAKTERYELIDSVFYLHAPGGFAGSKLAASAERRLGVTATARNYATVQKLSAMLTETEFIQHGGSPCRAPEHGSTDCNWKIKLPRPVIGNAMNSTRPFLRRGFCRDEPLWRYSFMQVHYLEIVTPDVDAVCATYTQLHGVSFSEPEAGLGNARTAALSDGGKIGVCAPMHEAEQPVVRPDLLVDDVEAAAKAAVESGGEIAHPPMELPGHGTFAIFIQGGIHHGVWQR